MIREAFVEAEKALTRRAFFLKIIKGAGLAAAYDTFGARLFGADSEAQANLSLPDAIPIVSAFGRLVVPVDEDPGWATFDPGITEYALDVFIREVFTLGNDLVFNGLLQSIIGFNEIPPQIGYGPRFLEMSTAAKGDYLTNILAGYFENDGVSDILSFSAIFMLLGVKQVFFLNYPFHIAVPNSEFQIPPSTGPRTGWQIMGFRGPVGPEEEQALRARAAHAPELPGVDLRNPFI